MTPLSIGVLSGTALAQAVKIDKEDPDRSSEKESNYSGIQAEV